MSVRFHSKCGDRVTLMNDRTTAVRSFVEFNHGLIVSERPLEDDVIFEVRVDRKVNVWNGSLEIGVMTSDPETMDLPATATKLRNSAWIMSGSAVMKDGTTILYSYGPELDTLCEGDCIGVMRTSHGELMFYVNGRCLGIAATDMPDVLFGVIDLYGRCVQVTICNSDVNRPYMVEDPNNDETMTSSDTEVIGLAALESYFERTPEPYHIELYQLDMGNESDNNIQSYNNTNDMYSPINSNAACSYASRDDLRFHQRCGILVKMSANNKSAERVRPLDDYNNGVVMTHRPLNDNELFEVRIDKLVDKWSGSIEMGVTSHNPTTLRFPSTMTNMDTGTIMMSGCKVLINGHGTCTEYGNYNLDELREGGTVGLMKCHGKLHYFINGVDQGVAADKVDAQVWGVVDLYGMTVKVTILDPSDTPVTPPIECVPLDTAIDMSSTMSETIRPDVLDRTRVRRERPRIDHESLLFHTLRDSNVIVINDGKTAHRPNAFELFNNGTVMTNRTLRTDELFQVRLDVVVAKWAGSIEIGVTQLSCNEIQSPFKLSNAESGTWALTGEDVIRDGSIIIPQYVKNLNTLVQGDTVGVVRRPMGVLHFYVNGHDLGPAAFNVPEHVFGVIDLYGRVAQVTIVDLYDPPAFTPESEGSSESNTTIYPEMCFHRVHGRNACLSRTRLTASRSTVYSEFNDAVLFSSRPLRECEMFELRIDRMVDCWIGSLEIGVTGIRPEQLECGGEEAPLLVGTATDLSRDTYILSGAAVMKDGECVRSGYALDLDTVSVGSRVGMMWHADRSLHYYLDGMDQGKAWYVPHLNIYAVVDLYGQCTQVTILQNEERQFNYNGYSMSDHSMLSNPRTLVSPQPPYCFSEYCGANVALLHDYTFARRLDAEPTAALVFSAGHLAIDELYEVKIVECASGYAGSLRFGVTDINILNAHINRRLPNTISALPPYTAYVDGAYIKYRTGGSSWELRSAAPSFDWLRVNDRVGLKKLGDQRVQLYYNTEPLDVYFENVPQKVYAVMEIFGCVTKIQAISKLISIGTSLPQPSAPPAEECSNMSGYENDSTNRTPEEAPAEPPSPTTEPRRRRHPLPYTFHYVHGRNIKLTSSDTVAVRTSGYKDGIAIVSQPLRRGHNFRFRVDKTGGEWSGSVGVGAVAVLPPEGPPPCASALEPPAWLATSDIVNDNGTYIATRMAAALEEVGEQSVVALHLRFNGELVLEADGRPLGALGVVPRSLPHVYPLVDLYGRVYQVSILLHPYVVGSGASIDLPIITENLREESLAELEDIDGADPRESETSETRVKKKMKALSQDNLINEAAQAGTSAGDEDAGPSQVSLHQSFIREDAAARGIQKSQSTQNFDRFKDGGKLEVDMRERLLQAFGVGAKWNEACDTNISQNDQYPEAEELEVMEESEASRWEQACYLQRLVESCGREGREVGGEGGGRAGGCERAHVALKLWRELERRRPPLRSLAAALRCHCRNCDPLAPPHLAGWVVISREESEPGENAVVGERRYWHVSSATLTEAGGEGGPFQRPPTLRLSPRTDIPPTQIWYDEEGKPHHAVIAIEVELDLNVENDRLVSFFIHLKPTMVFSDDHLISDD